jgi:hypothetical protein
MHDATLPLAVWLTVAYYDTRERARRGWDRLADDSGFEDATIKMIFLGFGVALAVAATAYILGVFNDAQSRIPSPAAPTP